MLPWPVRLTTGVPISATISPQVCAAIKRAASVEHRSFSNMLERLPAQALQEHGVLGSSSGTDLPPWRFQETDTLAADFRSNRKHSTVPIWRMTSLSECCR
jgi:hypothetical protein